MSLSVRLFIQSMYFMSLKNKLRLIIFQQYTKYGHFRGISFRCKYFRLINYFKSSFHDTEFKTSKNHNFRIILKDNLKLVKSGFLLCAFWSKKISNDFFDNGFVLSMESLWNYTKVVSCCFPSVICSRYHLID